MAGIIVIRGAGILKSAFNPSMDYYPEIFKKEAPLLISYHNLNIF